MKKVVIPKKVVPKSFAKSNDSKHKSEMEGTTEEDDENRDSNQTNGSSKEFPNGAPKLLENNLIVWTGGKKNLLMSHLKLAGDWLNATNPEIQVVPSLSYALQSKLPRYSNLILCPGQHEVPQDMGIGDDYTIVSPNGDATLKCSEPRPKLAATGNVTFNSITFDVAKSSTALAAVSGHIEANFCLFVPPEIISEEVRAIVVNDDSELILKNCTIGGFTIGVVALSGSNVRLEDCTLKGCKVAVEVYSGATVSLVRCWFKDFVDAAIIYVTNDTSITAGEGNNVLNGCEDIEMSKCKFFSQKGKKSFVVRNNKETSTQPDMTDR